MLRYSLRTTFVRLAVCGLWLLMAGPIPYSAPDGDLNQDGQVDALDVQCSVLLFEWLGLGDGVGIACGAPADCEQVGFGAQCRPGFGADLICLPNCLGDAVALGGEGMPVCDSPELDNDDCFGMTPRRVADLNCDGSMGNEDLIYMVAVVMSKLGLPGSPDLDDDGRLNFCDDDTDGDLVEDELDCDLLDPLVSDCDDGNPCTDDFCIDGVGCDHAPNDVPCNDGNECTIGDVCQAGECQPGGEWGCTLNCGSVTNACDLMGFGAGKAEFGYTGGDQKWTVPDGVTKVCIKMWGAAGGSRLGAGGGGGFSAGVLDVTPGQNLTVMVGGGGKGIWGNSGNAYGGGGSTAGGAGGAGRSAVYASNVQVIIAGGGGGGDDHFGPSGYSGAGGGANGQGASPGGGGGSQTGGAALNNGGSGGPGGAGGGGYWGGYGAGGNGHGGGGSGYVGGVKHGVTCAGSNKNPPNTGDKDYANDAGRSFGNPNSDDWNGGDHDGRPGRVVIRY